MKTLEALPEPVGKFIIDNATGTNTNTGTFYHYSDVCRLLKLYGNEKANAVLQEAYKKIFMDDAIIEALGKDDMRRIKDYLSLQTKK